MSTGEPTSEMASPDRCRARLRRVTPPPPPPPLETSSTTREPNLGRSVATLERCSKLGRGGSLDVYEEPESRSRLDDVVDDDEPNRRSRLVERSDVVDE